MNLRKYNKIHGFSQLLAGWRPCFLSRDFNSCRVKSSNLEQGRIQLTINVNISRMRMGWKLTSLFGLKTPEKLSVTDRSTDRHSESRARLYSIWRSEGVLFWVFRCVHASLYEGLSVGPSVRPSVGRSVSRERVFFKPRKLMGNGKKPAIKL